MTFASQPSRNLTLSGTNIFLNESFSDPSVLSQWSFGKSNANAANPAFVDGTLRLTSAQVDQGSFVLYNKSFSGQDGLTVTFDTYAYGGDGADGISWFLVDGKQSPTQAGAYGGSLGYASSVYHNQPGISGGYLGVGLDSYGNFSNPADSAAGGPGLTPDAIAVRGSQANSYKYLTGTGTLPTSLDLPYSQGRDHAKRSVQIDLSKTGLLNVYVDLNADGDFLDGGEKAINNFNVVAANGALPDTLKFGFAASTGCSTNIHEIDNLVVKVGETNQPPNPPIPPVTPPAPPTPPNPPIPPVTPPAPPTPPNPPIPPVTPPAPPTPPNPPIPPVTPPAPPTPPNPPIPPVTPPAPPSSLEILLQGSNFTYVENAAPASPVTLTINGNGQVNQATVQLGGGFNSNQDRLTILNQSGTSGTISGLNWIYDISNGLLTITGNGSAQDYQTALQSVVYQNISDNPSTDSRNIVYIISGNGFSSQSSQSFGIQAIDDAPIFTVPANLTVQSGAAGATISNFTFTDADTPVGNYQFQVVNAQGQVDSRFVIENGQLKLAPGQSLSVTDSPITLRILANGGAGNIFQSELLTILVSGGGTVQIPTVGTPITYIENDGPRSIGNLLTLSGDANTVIDRATVQISGNYSAGQDRLSVDGVAGTSGTTNGLAWTYDSATGTITFTGSGSPAAYQSALRLVTYVNSSENPSTAPRTISYTIGGSTTPQAITTVNVTGVDDPGILTLPPTTSIPSGTPGAIVGSITVTDPDTTYTFTVNDPRFEIVDGQLRLKAGESIAAGVNFIPLVITATGNTPGTVLTAPFNLAVSAGPSITPVPQSDVIFFDAAGTRKVQVWTVNNSNQVVNSTILKRSDNGLDWVLPANWSFIDTADFNGDGSADILWKDNLGDLQIWYLQPNGQFLGSQPVTLASGNRVQLPATANVVGLADMTRDGNLDVVTYDSGNGLTQIWALNGAGTVIGTPITVSNGGVPLSTGPNWQALDLADFDGDGDFDILYRNTPAGTISVWRMNGAQFVNATGLGTPTAPGFPALPANYQFGTTGDFTGDGKADIIWRVGGANPVLWQTTDANGAFSAVQTALPNVDAGWTLGGAGRFNGDATSDVVWRNADPNVGQTLWTFNNGVPTPSVFTYNGVPGTTVGAPALLLDSPTWQIAGVGDYAIVTPPGPNPIIAPPTPVPVPPPTLVPAPPAPVPVPPPAPVPAPSALIATP
jgi:hypothetical protein